MQYPEPDAPHNRYVILDANGVMLNRIASDAALLVYAGYGQYVAYEGDGDIPQIETEAPWEYCAVKPNMPMCQGDEMNVLTGEVTRAPQPEPPPEVFQEGLA